MPIEKSHKPHDVAHKKFHDGITYSELHGYDGEGKADGLTSGIIHVHGDSGTAIKNPYVIIGYVTEGTLVLIDSSDHNDHHELTVGHSFHIHKGSTFKWGAKSSGKAFYVMSKPLGHEVPHHVKTSF
ncbi:hypothetical protein BD779DRAFT_1538401 [Infundibulicybe gibba]|nr:hypothetical protein BD779DRAFT_1538401 [Infundibulicybe gibba]